MSDLTAAVTAVRAMRGRLEVQSSELSRELLKAQTEMTRLVDRKHAVERDITLLEHLTTELERMSS